MRDALRYLNTPAPLIGAYRLARLAGHHWGQLPPDVISMISERAHTRAWTAEQIVAAVDTATRILCSEGLGWGITHPTAPMVEEFIVVNVGRHRQLTGEFGSDHIYIPHDG